MIRTTAGDVALMHETCLEYFARRLSEGWKCIRLKYPKAVLQSPEGTIRPVDLRNDVETLRPNAGGDETNLRYYDGAEHAPDVLHNWEQVDESSPDDSATYVLWTNTDYRRDLYNLPTPGVSGTINSVTVWFRAKAMNYGDCAKAIIKTGGTVYEGGEKYINGWGNHSQIWNNNPNTSVAWTWSDIGSLQIGISLKTLYAPDRWTYCTQVYVEVDYTLGVVYAPHKEIYVVKKAGVRQDLATPIDFEIISTGIRQDL